MASSIINNMRTSCLARRPSTTTSNSRRPLRVQAYQVSMHSPSGCKKFEASADKTLLEGALAAGIDVPNLCGTGACGNCASRIVSGEVERTDFLLDDQQAAAGFVLLCTSHARSDLVVNTHQETEMHTVPYGL